MKLVVKRNREIAPINSRNSQNENKAETIELSVPEEFESFNKKIVFITPKETVWDVIVNNQYKITNAITKYDKVDYYIWLTKKIDGESIDFRTKTKTLNFYHNVDASDEITDEEIHGVNTVVNLLEEEIEKVENLNIEATKIGDTTTVTITKKDGTTESVNITDGQNGQDGKDGKDGQDAKINGKNSYLSIIKNLLDSIIKYENKFNFMRRGFTTLNLKLKKIFGKIDIGKNGYFSNDDLVVYMKKNRIFTDNKELDLLFIRLDKNRNGKIDYKEIYDETHPIYF